MDNEKEEIIIQFILKSLTNVSEDSCQNEPMCRLSEEVIFKEISKNRNQTDPIFINEKNPKDKKESWEFIIFDSEKLTEEDVLKIAKEVQMKELSRLPKNKEYTLLISARDFVEGGVLYTIKIGSSTRG